MGQAYFTPGDNIAGVVAALIASAVRSVDCAIFTFTRQDLASALIAAQARGVFIRVVADLSSSTIVGSKIATLRAAGVLVHTIPGRTVGTRVGIMHNKFLIVDGVMVATGSWNWTISAQNVNYENLVTFKDLTRVGQYRRAFEALWAIPSQSGGVLAEIEQD